MQSLTVRAQPILALLQSGLLFAYVNNFKVYKCPADNVCVNPALQGQLKVRSYSMNCWMNVIGNDNWNQTEGYNWDKSISR